MSASIAPSIAFSAGWEPKQRLLKPTQSLPSSEAAWHEIGPHDHPLESLYRPLAIRILEQALRRRRDGIEFGRTLDLKLDDHTITLPIDEMEKADQGFVLRRIRTGRPPRRRDQRHLHAMMLAAARQGISGAGRFEIQYLTTHHTVPIPLDGVMERRLTGVRQALSDAAAGEISSCPGRKLPAMPALLYLSSVAGIGTRTHIFPVFQPVCD